MPDETDLRKYIREEYKKCASDPIYFMKKYVKIQNPNEGGTISFNLYPFQEDTLNRFHDDRFLLILKSRQLGITTLVSAYSLWQMLFNSDRNILVISIKQEISKEIITKVRFANEHLPSWLRIQATEDNRLSLRLKNGSMIAATSSAKDAGRSKALSLLVLDEAAFIDEAREIWTSAFNTLSTGGRAIVLSTPNGVGNWFHEMWVNAEKKKNDFTTLRLPWQLHPKRDQKWREEQEKQLGQRGASQECFEGDTRIYTQKGLVKIRDIKYGDRVLTHTGNFENVIGIYKKESEDYSEVKSIINTKTRYVTNNHPFFKKNIGWTELNNINNGELCHVLPDKIQIDNNFVTLDLFKLISPNHFKFKLCNEDSQLFINDRKFKTIHNRYIKNDYKLGYILGCYLSEGWCQNNDNRVDFSFNWSEELNNWPQTLIKYIDELFGLKSYQFRKQTNSGHLTFCSQILCKTLKYFSEGDDCYTKHLSQNVYSHQNYDFLKGIADGCFVGDGMVLDEYNKQYSTRSEELMYDLQYILSVLNIGIVSRRTKYPNYPFKESICYILSILNTKNIHCENRNVSSLLKNDIFKKNYRFSNECGIDDNFYYAQLIKNPKTKDHPVGGTFYNIEVENDHSYVTEHFVVHNCDCDFLTSGTNVIDLKILEEYASNDISIEGDPRPEMGVKDPIEFRYSNFLWIWELPKEEKSYVVCADPARGDGSDYSAAHVLNIETLEQVAEFKQQIPPKEFADILVNLATEYNDSLLIVEYNGLGPAVLQRIVDRNYKNTFYSSLDLKVVEVQRQISTRYYAEEKKLKPGFTTTLSTRPLLISKLEAYFRERIVDIHSTRTIDELRTFIWDNGKAQAAEHYNDDLTMALCLGLWVRDTAIRLRQEGVIMSRNMLDKISVKRSNEDKTPIYTAKAMSCGQSQWEMRVGKGTDKPESLTWLLR